MCPSPISNASSNFAVARPPNPEPAAKASWSWHRADFHRRHLQWPLLLLTGLFAIANLWQVDLWLADRLYAWEGHAWTLRHGWTTQHLIHLAGRHLSTAVWLSVFAAWLVARGRPGWGQWRRPLLYLLTTTALSTLLVIALKHWSNVDCPWDLTRYGGVRPYIGLFELRPPGLERGLCFPAGHASGGYAWLASYFCLAEVRPRWRWTGLAVALGSGLLFGIAQQLRGAHFLSHDLATLAICWTCAVAMHRAFWRDELARPRSAGFVTVP